jgi:hypothetical protein
MTPNIQFRNGVAHRSQHGYPDRGVLDELSSHVLELRSTDALATESSVVVAQSVVVVPENGFEDVDYKRRGRKHHVSDSGMSREKQQASDIMEVSQ